MLRETISSKLGTQEIYSSATVALKKMKKLILIILMLPALSFSAENEVPGNLKLFCSSGGFLYNNLDVQNNFGLVSFLATGYPWGFGTDKEAMGLDEDFRISSVRISIRDTACRFKNTDKLSLKCFNKVAEAVFIDEENDKQVSMLLEGMKLDLSKDELFVQNGGKQVLSFCLGSCADLTGLD